MRRDGVSRETSRRHVQQIQVHSKPPPFLFKHAQHPRRKISSNLRKWIYLGIDEGYGKQRLLAHRLSQRFCDTSILRIIFLLPSKEIKIRAGCTTHDVPLTPPGPVPRCCSLLSPSFPSVHITHTSCSRTPSFFMALVHIDPNETHLGLK